MCLTELKPDGLQMCQKPSRTATLQLQPYCTKTVLKEDLTIWYFRLLSQYQNNLSLRRVQAGNTCTLEVNAMDSLFLYLMQFLIF